MQRSELVKVEAIIREASDEAILPRFRRLERHEISEKNPGDLVTVADKEAEHLLAAALTQLLPGSKVVGEEDAAANTQILEAFDGDTPVWVIDPVDGTQNFVDGVPCFAVIVALVQANETVAGWIYDPINDAMIWAKRGEGAWEAGRRLTPVRPGRVSNMTGSLGTRMRRRLEAMAESGTPDVPKLVKRYRCVGREYMDLGRGTLDFCNYGGNLKPWDHAAGVLIHAESGGYSARVESGGTYRVERRMGPGNLLLAPTPSTWRDINRILPR